ncbi:MAG TPA: methyl-accepting chemotaxis protein [Chloroflexia bacterium]|nr:methyl-accepting chemotaxis protein [Chloroflexia bacterium]
MEKTEYRLAEFNRHFGKPVMAAFGLLAIIAGIAELSLALFFNSSSFNNGNQAQIVLALLLLLTGLVVLVLLGLNKLNQAAFLFCASGLIFTTVAVGVAGLDSLVPVLYFLVLVVAAALLSPLAVLLFGLSGTVCYVGISFWLISRLPAPLPLDKSINILLLSLVLSLASLLLAWFSRNLRHLIYSAEKQVREISELNQALQSHRRSEAVTARQVSELSGMLSELIREQDTSSYEQTRMVTDMAATTQELEAAARRIADSAMSVATVAEKAQHSVEAGQSVASQGVEAIELLRERVQEINLNMQGLSRQLARISEVTNLIGDIADETNLLALNATIEAAGAREYGRRFAAVAEEVQRLARRSAAAVEQIQETVQEINQASSKALAATEQGLKDAQVGDELAGSLKVANDDVLHLVLQTSGLASNIASATSQQREASSQILELVQRIIDSVQQIAKANQEVSTIASNLEETSGRMIHPENLEDFNEGAAEASDYLEADARKLAEEDTFFLARSKLN